MCPERRIVLLRLAGREIDLLPERKRRPHTALGLRQVLDTHAVPLAQTQSTF